MSSKSNEPVVVRTFNDQFAANVAKSALDAAGIDSLVRSDDAGGQYTSALGFTQGVHLVVRAEDARRAEEVLGAEKSGSQD
jgi:hypothetical protein